MFSDPERVSLREARSAVFYSSPEFSNHVQMIHGEKTLRKLADLTMTKLVSRSSVRVCVLFTQRVYLGSCVCCICQIH